jgi:hypothetical protein
VFDYSRLGPPVKSSSREIGKVMIYEWRKDAIEDASADIGLPSLEFHGTPGKVVTCLGEYRGSDVLLDGRTMIFWAATGNAEWNVQKDYRSLDLERKEI